MRQSKPQKTHQKVSKSLLMMLMRILKNHQEKQNLMIQKKTKSRKKIKPKTSSTKNKAKPMKR